MSVLLALAACGLLAVSLLPIFAAARSAQITHSEDSMAQINHDHASRVLTARHRPVIGRLVWRGWTPNRRYLRAFRLGELRVVQGGVTIERREWPEVTA